VGEGVAMDGLDAGFHHGRRSQELRKYVQIFEASKSLFAEDASTSSPLATRKTGTIGHGTQSAVSAHGTPLL